MTYRWTLDDQRGALLDVLSQRALAELPGEWRASYFEGLARVFGIGEIDAAIARTDAIETEGFEVVRRFDFPPGVEVAEGVELVSLTTPLPRGFTPEAFYTPRGRRIPMR